jgi:hypothetical protein
MFILAVSGQEEEGAYAAHNDDGERVVYIFVDKDDAVRYAGLLEADDFPEMSVVEVDDDDVIRACVSHGFEYYVITPDDIVIPPRED